MTIFSHRLTILLITIFLLPRTSVVGQEADGDSKVFTAGYASFRWQKLKDGWHLSELRLNEDGQSYCLANTSGMHTIIFSKTMPGQALTPLQDPAGKNINFPEPHYRYMHENWGDLTQAAYLGTAGKTVNYFPNSAATGSNGSLLLGHETAEAFILSTWEPSALSVSDIVVTVKLRAKQAGYYSIATPTLFTTEKEQLKWGTIPGQFQGNFIETDLVKSLVYGQGIPDRPIMIRDRTVTTLSPLISNKSGVTIAVIPQPGLSRDPWAFDHYTHRDWNLGMSLMNRDKALSPTVYYPVLGQQHSFLEAGDSLSFSFLYTIQRADWFTVYKHAAFDIYRMKDVLALKKPTQSLTDRILAMGKYVVDDRTSRWRLAEMNGLTIGAQDYLGGVYEADKDAMKNSDYGAMWMFSKLSNDSVMLQTRLPYARNFKLVQQNQNKGFFYGATNGQYFLWKSKRFTEEWGPYTEPIAVTYYLMIDIGNVLLYNPQDAELRDALRLAAERLLSWMKPNGSWAVAYDQATGKELFTEIEDLRPTFYGLMVAYRILGDIKYLQAACKGADWFINQGVNRGRFIGVCGDTRFVPDFATGQSAQALLDLFDITKNKKYLDAAIRTAQIYTTSIYTHPVADSKQKSVDSTGRFDWEISQVGLSFEHGGTSGSANSRGPILLASHAGMFIRFFQLTQDSLFATMARAAIWGRHAFVDSATNVASYYWNSMNKGPGPYPNHAWWQIGLLTDYLLSELALRSDNAITFPSGFLAPKVGPHKTYGFAPGMVYQNPADLFFKSGIVSLDNPSVDYVCAINRTQKKLYIILLNNGDDVASASLKIDVTNLREMGVGYLGEGSLIDKNGRREVLDLNKKISFAPFGLQTIELEYH